MLPTEDVATPSEEAWKGRGEAGGRTPYPPFRGGKGVEEFYPPLPFPLGPFFVLWITLRACSSSGAALAPDKIRAAHMAPRQASTSTHVGPGEAAGEDT